MRCINAAHVGGVQLECHDGFLKSPKLRKHHEKESRKRKLVIIISLLCPLLLKFSRFEDVFAESADDKMKLQGKKYKR